MLGAAMLTRLHPQLEAAVHTKQGAPFGGLNMILAGDFSATPAGRRSTALHAAPSTSQQPVRAPACRLSAGRYGRR